MKATCAIAVAILLRAACAQAIADTGSDMGRQLAQKKSRPCVWLTETVQEPGCYYVEDIVMTEIIDKLKLTTWQAKEYYSWTLGFSKSADGCGANKDKNTCEAEAAHPCFWYVKGGNRITPPGKASCDLHPLAIDYNYWINIKYACKGAPAIFDGKCALEGATKAKCLKIKSNGNSCVWDPKRSFPCGAPASTFNKLTNAQRRLLPSYLDFNVGTSNQKDFEAVYGKCSNSLVTFREQLCNALDGTTCSTYSKWCIFEKATKQCQNRTAWWYKNGLGGDKHMTRVFQDLEAGCKPIKNPNQCSKFTYP